MHVHCKIITMVRLVNTPFTSQSYCFMVVVRKFKIYCPSDFHVPNAVLLTIVSLLGVNPQGGFILSLEVRIFCVFCILMLCSWSLADLSGTVPPQVSQSPKTVNNSPSAFQKPHLSEANQPLQSPHPEPPILLGSQTQCHYSLPPIPQRLPDNLGQPHAPGPVKVIQTSQSQACFPGRARSFPGRPHKGSCPHFPFASSASSPALMFPWVAPMGWGAPSSWKL